MSFQAPRPHTPVAQPVQAVGPVPTPGFPDAEQPERPEHPADALLFGNKEASKENVNTAVKSIVDPSVQDPQHNSNDYQASQNGIGGAPDNSEPPETVSIFENDITWDDFKKTMARAGARSDEFQPEVAEGQVGAPTVSRTPQVRTPGVRM